MQASDNGDSRLGHMVALITGGASGIGAATAELFVAKGAKVVIADIQDEKGEALAITLGPNAHYVHCDVSQEQDISAAVDLAVTKFGALDIMFNNAGIAGPIRDPFCELDIEAFESVYAVNVRGVVLGVKHAARVMKPQRKGSILCTASIAGLLGSGGHNCYHISKHAVIGIVRAAASELGQYGIRVNCISPHAVSTPLLTDFFGGATSEEIGKIIESVSVLKGVKLGRQDIANAALFLASDESRYISGQNLVVDGAYTVTAGIIPGEGALHQCLMTMDYAT